MLWRPNKITYTKSLGPFLIYISLRSSAEGLTLAVMTVCTKGVYHHGTEEGSGENYQINSHNFSVVTSVKMITNICGLEHKIQKLTSAYVIWYVTNNEIDFCLV